VNQRKPIPVIFKTPAVVVCVAVVAACSTVAPTGAPEVEAIGDDFFAYRGPEIEIVLGTGYADGQGGEFVLLGASFAGVKSDSMTRVDRSGITLRTPDRQSIPLMSQEAFVDAYGRIATATRLAEAFSPTPLESRPIRRPCGDWFFRAPSDGLTRDVLTFSSIEVCGGVLYFEVPGGVRPGRWVFRVDLEDGVIEIPFDLD
jgi:hypothetical protein